MSERAQVEAYINMLHRKAVREPQSAEHAERLIRVARRWLKRAHD